MVAVLGGIVFTIHKLVESKICNLDWVLMCPVALHDCQIREMFLNLSRWVSEFPTLSQISRQWQLLHLCSQNKGRGAEFFRAGGFSKKRVIETIRFLGSRQ
jgi:hypothetical protein